MSVIVEFYVDGDTLVLSKRDNCYKEIRMNVDSDKHQVKYIVGEGRPLYTLDEISPFERNCFYSLIEFGRLIGVHVDANEHHYAENHPLAVLFERYEDDLYLHYKDEHVDFIISYKDPHYHALSAETCSCTKPEIKINLTRYPKDGCKEKEYYIYNSKYLDIEVIANYFGIPLVGPKSAWEELFF